MARPSLVVALMVRNEADRYLRSALSAWSDFADEIVALDDGSTDATPDLLAEFGCDVIRWTGDRAWGAEASPRAALWNAAVETGARLLRKRIRDKPFCSQGGPVDIAEGKRVSTDEDLAWKPNRHRLHLLVENIHGDI